MWNRICLYFIRWFGGLLVYLQGKEQPHQTMPAKQSIKKVKPLVSKKEAERVIKSQPVITLEDRTKQIRKSLGR